MLPRLSCGRTPRLLVRGEAWVVAGRSAESAVDVARDGDFAGALFGKKVDATVTPGVGLAKYARLEAEGAVHVDPTVAHVCRWRKPFLPEKTRTRQIRFVPRELEARVARCSRAARARRLHALRSGRGRGRSR